MLILTFWKVSPKGKTFTFIGVPPITVAVIMAVIIITVAVAKTAVVITPRKGSGKNPKKSSPRRKEGFPLGFLIQKGARVGVISAPINASPAQKR